MSLGILGGGISGIALQRFLRREAEVLEAGPVPGGLCRTFWKDGFGYDIGGHILFSKYEHVNRLIGEVLDGNLNHCRRLNQILFGGRYVKYPFENDLAALEPQDRYECLIGYLQAVEDPKPRNLEEWAYSTFGPGIADKYFLPYNRKIWKMEPRETSLHWVSRIPRPPMEDVVKSAVGIETEGYTHQLDFRYPLHGGFESVVKALVKDPDRIHCDFTVRSVRRRDGGWVVSDGRQKRAYGSIVVSYPIHEAVRAFEDVPPDVLEAVARLRYNPMAVVLVAVGNESLLGRSAVYLPDPEVLPHRVCCMGYFSPHMVRPGTSSLVAEVTFRPGDEVDRMGEGTLVERVVGDLDRVGLLRRQDVILTECRRIPYAYPVYDLAYPENTRVVREYFASLGVPLLGRFAEFDYINSDECLHRAMTLARRLDG